MHVAYACGIDCRKKIRDVGKKKTLNIFSLEKWELLQDNKNR